MRKAKQVFVSILAVLCLLSATASALELPRSARALPGETVEPRGGHFAK